jgi:hypothetical protein
MSMSMSISMSMSVSVASTATDNFQSLYFAKITFNSYNYFCCQQKTFRANNPKDGGNEELSALISTHSTYQINGSYFLKVTCPALFKSKYSELFLCTFLKMLINLPGLLKQKSYRLKDLKAANLITKGFLKSNGKPQWLSETRSYHP